ncbi:major facilitator superfamily domain-containing protein [Xylariaceae sp. FL1019]|nr:major facilitator superfamily domain-containing protein [Xylariaceae sp. FL1019]
MGEVNASKQSPPQTPPPVHKHEGIEEETQAADISGDIDPADEVTGVKLLLIHTSMCLCTFLVGLDFNVIATAVPVITVEFDSAQDIGWYGAAFMLALCASQPLAGKTYTIFPKKTVYLMYMFLFEVGSLVCALAPTSNALIVGRAVAGLGASGVFAGALTLLTTIIPLHKRAIWTGTCASTFALASIVGPILGGALTQRVSWRWCFWINLPIGGAGSVIFFFLVHLRTAKTENQPLRKKFASLDFIGFLLIAGAFTQLLLVLQWGGLVHAWSSSVEIGLFVGAGVVLVLFVLWQLRRGEDALIPPRIFTVNRNPALICAAAFFVAGPFQNVIYWLPVWFQAVLGASPTQSGINYFPTVIADVLAAFIGSGIVMAVGWWNPFLLLAEAFVSLGAGLLSTVEPGISSGHWIGYQIFGGIGYSLAINISHLGMQSSLPQDLVPIGASTLLAIISTSCAVFNAVGQTVFQTQLQADLSRVVSPATVKQIIDAGVLNFDALVDTNDLPMVINAYSKAITSVFYIPASAPVISFGLVCGCRWYSSKSKKTTKVDIEKPELDESGGKS